MERRGDLVEGDDDSPACGKGDEGGDIQFAVMHKPSDLLSVGDQGSQAAMIAKDLLELADVKILHGQKPLVAKELDEMFGLRPVARGLITGWAMQGKGPSGRSGIGSTSSRPCCTPSSGMTWTQPVAEEGEAG